MRLDPDVPMIVTARRTVCLAVLLAAAASASAQFKIVEPDGRITYTDRPPPPVPGAQVTLVRRSGAAPQATDASLPLELRATVARFPVTLYTMADCTLCDSARRMLRTRGVPHAERTVDDNGGDELVRLTGARAVPSLMVGSQVMRGYAETDWQATLDLAGYPRESRLPRQYVHPAATPLVARAAPPATAPVAAPVAPEPRPEPPVIDGGESAPGAPSIRF